MAPEQGAVEGWFLVEVSVELEGALVWPLGLNWRLGCLKVVVLVLVLVLESALESVLQPVLAQMKVWAPEGPLAQTAVLLARR